MIRVLMPSFDAGLFFSLDTGSSWLTVKRHSRSSTENEYLRRSDDKLFGA